MIRPLNYHNGQAGRALRLGITTTTLYAYVNGDGSVKAAGQAVLNQDSDELKKSPKK